MTECFRCGDDGHLSRNCPTRTRGHLTPVRDAPRGAPGTRQPPPAPAHAPADPALARTWAQVIRDTLGWGPPEERARD